MVLLVLQGILNLLIEVLHQQAFDWVTHSLLVERETERLLSSALDEQTTIRGYLINGDNEFLEPYGKAQIAFKSSLNRLEELLQGNSSQLGRLNQLEAIHRWRRESIQRVLAGNASKTQLPGKSLFDPMREIVKIILREEDRVLSDRKQQLQRINQIKGAMEIFNIVAILAGVSWNLWLLRRRVEIPLRQLTAVGQAWRAGKMDVRLDYSTAD